MGWLKEFLPGFKTNLLGLVLASNGILAQFIPELEKFQSSHTGAASILAGVLVLIISSATKRAK